MACFVLVVSLHRSPTPSNATTRRQFIGRYLTANDRNSCFQKLLMLLLPLLVVRVNSIDDDDDQKRNLRPERRAITRRTRDKPGRKLQSSDAGDCSATGQHTHTHTHTHTHRHTEPPAMMKHAPQNQMPVDRFVIADQ